MAFSQESLTANEALLRQTIRHRVNLEGYSNAVNQDVQTLLNAADAELSQLIRDRLEAGRDNWTSRRMQSLIREIAAINSENWGAVAEEVRKSMGAFATKEAWSVADKISEEINTFKGWSFPKGVDAETFAETQKILTELAGKYGVLPSSIRITATSGRVGGVEGAIAAVVHDKRIKITADEYEMLKAAGTKVYKRTLTNEFFKAGDIELQLGLGRVGKPSLFALSPSGFEKSFGYTKYTPAGWSKLRTVLTHEFGHVLNPERPGDLSEIEKGIAKNISTYALTNTNEMKAEAFVKYEAGLSSSEEKKLISDILPVSKPSPIQGNTDVFFSITQPTAEQLVAMVATEPITIGPEGKLLLEEIFSTLAAGKEDLIRQAIRHGMVEGQTIEEIVRRLVGTRANKFMDGIIERNRRAAEAMVRTIVLNTSNRAADMVYAKNTDLIKGCQRLETLDRRTCLYCMKMDKIMLPVEGGPRPPSHINCRGFVTPVLKSWKELGVPIGEMTDGTRASMDGQVPGDMTYQEWLRAHPDNAEAALGKARAKLFLDKKLDISAFTSDRGKVITLAELYAK